jgi:hypothetical protein
MSQRMNEVAPGLWLGGKRSALHVLDVLKRKNPAPSEVAAILNVSDKTFYPPFGGRWCFPLTRSEK